MSELKLWTLLLIGAAFVGSPQSSTAGVLDDMKCVSPALTSYWNTPDQGSEVVVAYSANGFFRDFESRLPSPIFAAFTDASTKALKANRIKKYGVGIERVTADFYSNLRATLSNIAGLTSEACGIQVQDLVDLISARYVYKEANAKSDWYSTMGISEKNVRNDQLLALIAMYQSSPQSHCDTVYREGGHTIRVCQ